uniref:Uncharacterized protein n=1 Tax=Chromera velia CCMP2878 TaxID=1169474 RepID=A0A0G4HAX4_9ALVE|eukprot:Cvel_25688.t1-p1 / transcript=Cvel_25688.t1 / gene=Cvel_25688 / organism=Chromera_velia_CCMP2878 / gene_product=hypothetical protein / transcript_product=hypothetical protein / location=Cvel_scaffold2946:1718-2992(-) / protein_length=425 / sequence_SO=supercontig / SO=protein_coding / is_pseudo=false
MKKGGEINEKAYIGMMEVKEACDEMVEGVLMLMLQMPLDGVFSKSRREYMMMQKGMEYREYNWRLTNKVRSEEAAYIDAHLATEHIAARAGAQVDVASEMLCSVAEMVKEHGVMEIHGRVVHLQEEMKKTWRGGGSGPMGGKHSMYPTCDIQSGGITVEDVDIDGPGVTEKGIIPNTGVDVRQTGGGGMVNRGMNDGKKGDGGISLMLPNGRPRVNGNTGANGVGGGGMQDSFGRQTGTESPKRVRQVTHSSEGKQGNTDSGFVTPRSIGEREGEGQQMQKRAVMPFRPSPAGRDRPTVNEMQIFPPNVPMVGGRIAYETLVDLPVYRQPKNGGLGGKLWQECMDDARLMVFVICSETRRDQVRREMISALRNSAVDGDLEGCDLLELVYAFIVQKKRVEALCLQQEKEGEGGREWEVARWDLSD